MSNEIKSDDYSELLRQVEQNQKELFWWANNHSENKPPSKKVFLGSIEKYLKEETCCLPEKAEDTATRIYNDWMEDSILTDPLRDVWVERIIILAWNEVRAVFINGKAVKLAGFNSPEHAVRVLKRLAQRSQLDTSKPVISGRLSNGARITAFLSPSVDKDVGAICFIQKKYRIFSVQDYTSNDFAVKKELDSLNFCVSHGISILLTGGKGSGKTALMNFLLFGRNAVALEKGRELEATRSILLQDDDLPNNILQHVLELAPEVIAFNFDTDAAQVASLSGCSVIATTLAGGPQEALMKSVVQLNQNQLGYQAALELTARAFPLIVTLNTYNDNRRRIANISECRYTDGGLHLTTIWKYQVQRVIRDGPDITIHGRHQQTDNISEDLADRMALHGAVPEEIKQFEKEEEKYAGSKGYREAGG